MNPEHIMETCLWIGVYMMTGGFVFASVGRFCYWMSEIPFEEVWDGGDIWARRGNVATGLAALLVGGFILVFLTATTVLIVVFVVISHILPNWNYILDHAPVAIVIITGAFGVIVVLEFATRFVNVRRH